MRKLYLFSNTTEPKWLSCLAMSDTGHVLASHICSNLWFMEGDLITGRPERKEMYEEHFGGELGKAFEIVSLKLGEVPPEEVLELNQELGKKALLDEKQMAKFEIEFSE